MKIRKRVAAIAAAAVLAGSGFAFYASNAHASVQYGNHIEIGCSTPQGVLVYTVVDNDGNPTGEMSAVGWACNHGDTAGLDLQNYVRVGIDQFGNVVVREYPTRRALGTPIAIDVVRGDQRNWERPA